MEATWHLNEPGKSPGAWRRFICPTVSCWPVRSATFQKTSPNHSPPVQSSHPPMGSSGSLMVGIVNTENESSPVSFALTCTPPAPPLYHSLSFHAPIVMACNPETSSGYTTSGAAVSCHATSMVPESSSDSYPTVRHRPLFGSGDTAPPGRHRSMSVR